MNDVIFLKMCTYVQTSGKKYLSTLTQVLHSSTILTYFSGAVIEYSLFMLLFYTFSTHYISGGNIARFTPLHVSDSCSYFLDKNIYI